MGQPDIGWFFLAEAVYGRCIVDESISFIIPFRPHPDDCLSDDFYMAGIPQAG
jgi:hypothetical protein